jgi:predicted esterase
MSQSKAPRTSAHPALAPYHRAEFQSRWTADYMLRTPPENIKPARLVVLLHGFSLRGEWMYRKLERVIAEDAIVIAPSGPFPLIQRSSDGRRYELGYSWYFYDPHADEYLIDMKVGADFVRGLLKHLRLDHLPTTLIGFSQGGFLAPFVAAGLPNCSQVIGIAAQFLSEEIPGSTHYRMDQIHGELDDTVLLADAESSHLRLKERGVAGDFKPIAGLGHKIDDQVREALRELLSAPLK